MRLILPIVAPLLVQVSGSEAIRLAVTGATGSVTGGLPLSGIDNESSIRGGASAALMVLGSAVASVRNQDQITASAGVKASASSSRRIVNTGTIKATSVGTSSTWAVGFSQ